MEDRDHNERLLKIYKGNLKVLLERKAQLGLDVPLSLENEIKAAQEQIAVYEPLVPSPKTQEAAQKVSGEIDLTTIFIQGTQIAAEQARQAIQNQDILQQNKEIIGQQAVDTLWRHQTKEVIHEVVAEVAAAKVEVANAKVIADERYEQEQVVRVQRQQEHDDRFTLMELAIMEVQTEIASLVSRTTFNRILLVVLILVGIVVLYYLRVSR
jgi:K+-sensing histidine kinase KdpD